MANRSNVNIFLNKEWVTLSCFWSQGKFHAALEYPAAIGRVDRGIIILQEIFFQLSGMRTCHIFRQHISMC